MLVALNNQYMFEEKKGFEQIDDNKILWRYQDLPRYLDLLLRKQLFFTRIDQFEDPFEGKYNLPEKADPSKDPSVRETQQQYAHLIEKHSQNRIGVTVNTWHLNNNENYAMWNIYARSNGVAVQTTYKNLKESFHVSDKPVHIGKVKYYSETNDQIPLHDPLAPFTHKRCIYQYENEVRCCYILPQTENNEYDWEEQGTYNGVFIPVDLNILFEKVYISPYAPRWFRDLIARTNDAFNIQKEIVHSTVFQSESFL
jgi:hypothetical protein